MPARSDETPTKGELTRLQIEDAAMELFMNHGYHATSMRQIARQAGLALGGIYNHFSGKEEIFKAIIIDKHPYKKVLPLILAAEGSTVEDFLGNAVRITLNELGSQPYYLKLMFIEIVEFNGRHGAPLLREIAPRVLPAFERLARARKELRVRNPALLMRAFFGMLISYILTEMLITNSTIRQLMPKDTREVYVDMFLHGILKEGA